MEVLNENQNGNGEESGREEQFSGETPHSHAPVELELVKLLISKECQLLKTGYKFKKMVYYFCSCDPDQREPMCKDCYDTCHADHVKKEVVFDEISAICHCGINFHKISKETNQTENVSFQKKCFFMDWSVMSKLNIYYENNQTKAPFCIFCANFCEEMANLTKKTFRGGDKAFDCSCKNEVHHEPKNIYKKLREFKKLTEFEFEYLTPTHLINILTLSEKSYNNTFNSLNMFLRQLKDNLENDPTYVIDPNIGSSAAMKSLETFSLLADSCNNFFYFERNSELMNDILDRKFIYNLMEKKFNYKTGKTIWLLKNYAMNIYYKFVVLRDFETIPILSIKDIENLHPLQRLLYVRSLSSENLLSSEYFENLNFNPLDRTINIIERLNNIKDKHEVVYEILNKCYEICLLYASLHQFNKEQIMRFCSVNDDVISGMESDKKMIPIGLLNSQLRMMIPMIKSLLYMVYYHNDEVLESYLRGQKEVGKLNFFHSNSEVGKIINKNCINVLNYVRNSKKSIEGAASMGPQGVSSMNYNNMLMNLSPSNKKHVTSQLKDIAETMISPTLERFPNSNPFDINLLGDRLTSVNTGAMKNENAEKMKHTIDLAEKLVRKVLVYATTITSIAINYPDHYLIGLRKLMDKNRELYLNYVVKDRVANSNVLAEEKNFIEKVRSLKEELEETYESYFKFNLNESALMDNVANSIQSLFNMIKLYNYQTPSAKVINSNFFSNMNMENINNNEMNYVVAGDQQASGLNVKKVMPKSKTIFYHAKGDEAETPYNEERENLKGNSNSPEAMMFKYKTLMNKSVFIFSVVKSIRIILSARRYQNKLTDSGNFNPEEDTSCLFLDDHYLDEVMKLLYFYVENNPDNCMVVLTGEILNTFAMLDKSQLDRFLDFFNYVLFTVAKYNVNMVSNSNLMKLLSNIVRRISGDPQRVDLLEKTIRAIKLFTEISFINYELVYVKLRDIIRDLFKLNPILSEFRNYLVRDDTYYKIQVKLSSCNLPSIRDHFDDLLRADGKPEKIQKGGDILVIDENKNTEKKFPSKHQSNRSERDDNPMELHGYKIQFLFDTYVKFLKIVNLLFDGNATLNELEFLSTIMNKLDVPKILKKKDIDLNLRIEVLKFFRMSSIDVIINKNRLVEYHSKFVAPVQSSEEGGLNEENTHFFFRDLLMVNESSFNLNLESQILKYELKNFQSIVSNARDKTNSTVLEYFQDGIVLPLYVFLNKFMAVIYTRKGYDYLKLYEIVVYFLKLKRFIIEAKGKFQIQSNFEFKNIFRMYLEKKRNHYSLINSGFNEDDLKELVNDIEEMNKPHFEILNYKNVYAYFEKHLESFFNKPKIKSLKKMFEKKDLNYDVQKLKKMEGELKNMGLLKTVYERKIFDGIVKYENDKNKFSESAFVQNLGEQNIQFHSNYRAIILKTVFFLVNDKELSSKYQKENFWHLFKLLQYDTVPSQTEIYSLYKTNKEYIKLDKIVNLFLENLLSLIFSSCNPISNFMSEDYYLSITIVKILKYMCEEHNNHFQTIFFKELEFDYFYTNYNGKVQRGKVSLFNLLLGIVSKIVILSKWEKVKFGADEKSISYFYDIFFVIIELLIEIVQGTKPENLELIIHHDFDHDISPFNSFLYSVKNLLLRDKNDSAVVYKVRNDIINFVVAFLEEKATPKKVITQIASVYNPYTVFETIVNTLKKLYYKKTSPDDVNKVKDYKNDIFDHKKCQYFVSNYFSDLEFCQTPEFELSNRLYQYVKLLATQFDNEDAINIIDSIKAYEENQLIELYNKKVERRGDSNIGNSMSSYSTQVVNNMDQDEVVLDDSYVQNYFAVKFFEKITRSVTVQKDEDEVTVLFTLNPLVPYLSQNTKNTFYESVNRETRFTKLFSLMEYSDYFFDEIQYTSNRLSKNWFAKFMSDLDYYFFEVIFFILTVVINLILIIKLDTKEVEEDYSFIYPPIRILAIIQASLNFLILLNWFIFKFPLYYQIEKKKYCLKKKIQVEDVSTLEYLVIIFYYTILMKSETNGFIANVIFSAVGASAPTMSFIFPVQQLVIINLSETLKNIIRSLTQRYKQLLANAMFLVIFIYVFSTIGFFFLLDDFILNHPTTHAYLYPPDLAGSGFYPDTTNQENQCGSLLYCFFTHLDYGLRTDSGIADNMRKISLKDDAAYYMGRFFYEIMFFIVIVVFLLSVVFSTIIDTFAELRDASRKNENDKMNFCYICGARREELERNCINYDKHVNTDHNIWTYVDYIIGLKFVDPQETNAINSHVISMIEQKSISWFPSAKTGELKEA